MDEKEDIVLDIKDPSKEDLSHIDDSYTLESDDKILSDILACDTTDVIKQHLADLKGYKRLTAEEEIELAKRKSEGDEEARKQLILCNYRLVISRAKKLYGVPNLERSHGVVEFLDYVSWGEQGLVKAVDKFDYKAGTKFSTYATYWIDCYIQKNAKENTSLIALPANVVALASKIRKIVNEQGEMTPEQVWEFLKASEDKITLNAVKNAMTSNFYIDSLDRPTNEDNDTTLLDKGSYINQDINSVVTWMNNEENKKMVEELLSNLSPKEQIVVKLRCGIDDDNGLTFDEIGKRLNMSKQATSQIFHKAVEKLKKKAIRKDNNGKN